MNVAPGKWGLLYILGTKPVTKKQMNKCMAEI